MAREESYLVRGANGRMHTVRARSVRSAAKEFARRYKVRAGDVFEVKPRGHGDWTAYKAS